MRQLTPAAICPGNCTSKWMKGLCSFTSTYTLNMFNLAHLAFRTDPLSIFVVAAFDKWYSWYSKPTHALLQFMNAIKCREIVVQSTRKSEGHLVQLISSFMYCIFKKQFSYQNNRKMYLRSGSSLCMDTLQHIKFDGFYVASSLWQTRESSICSAILHLHSYYILRAFECLSSFPNPHVQFSLHITIVTFMFTLHTVFFQCRRLFRKHFLWTPSHSKE